MHLILELETLVGMSWSLIEQKPSQNMTLKTERSGFTSGSSSCVQARQAVNDRE